MELKCITNSEHTRHRGEKYFKQEMARKNFPAAQRMEPCVRYMMSHLNEPLKISMLSAMVGLSESSFFEHFKTATGRSPVKFLIHARMQWASELLVATNLQIKEIAGLVGYNDQLYFSRLFKLAYGLSPRNYRAQQDMSNNCKRAASKGKTKCSGRTLERIPYDRPHHFFKLPATIT